MSLTQRLRLAAQQPRETLERIDMHITGEPARILYKGFPEVSGTLLEQRAQARNEHDNVRRRLMLEPRALGHFLVDTYYHDISPSGIDLR
jgi:proline racemase